MTEHSLDVTPETVTQYFSRDTRPVLTVDPGESVVVQSLDAWGHLERPERPGTGAPQMFTPRHGHCLTGPIEVRGAKPGMTLAVHLAGLRPGTWGWTGAALRDSTINRQLGLAEEPPAFLMWDLDPQRLTGVNDRGLAVSLAPFLGIIGLPPEEPGEHSTAPPRPRGGGNIDCRELTAGSTLYLPVTVPGAMLCVGDGHGAQGDGEVSGTAIECGMASQIRLDLVTDPDLPVIHATTPKGRLTFGFSVSLNDATIAALDAMITWMQSLFTIDRPTALALASVAVNLRVTQVANGVWGIHAFLADEAIR
jgi:acetamidase/formamidase